MSQYGWKGKFPLLSIRELEIPWFRFLMSRIGYKYPNESCITVAFLHNERHFA